MSISGGRRYPADHWHRSSRNTHHEAHWSESRVLTFELLCFLARSEEKLERFKMAVRRRFGFGSDQSAPSLSTLFFFFSFF